MRRHQLAPEVVDVLSRSSVTGAVLVLPEQLERDSYVRVDKALRAIGGKWDRKAGGHTFPFDPSDLLSSAVEDGSVIDRKQELQFFETPTALAERMVTIANLDACQNALEPSAGHGRIVRLLAQPGVEVTAVEIDATNAAVLRAAVPEAKVVNEDFLGWAPRQYDRFEAIVMNPPFTRFQDVAHIRQAHALLAPGGTLVAICSESPFFRSEAIAREFREWIDYENATVERLPEATFKESGTGVRARLVVFSVGR